MSTIQPTCEYRKLIVCSALIYPVRRWIPDILHIWLHRFLKAPSHTFALDLKYYPSTVEIHKNYWYCAGDYLSEDDPSVDHQLLDANITYAKCLVKSNIKDDHVKRPELVIRGKYSVHYMCHNITNRVLFACKGKPTLADLSIPSYGYEIVARTKMAVYGHSRADWYERVSRCHKNLALHDEQYKSLTDGDTVPFHPAGPCDIPSDYRYELRKLRQNAATSVREYYKFKKLLDDIDQWYYEQTGSLIERYDNKDIDDIQFHNLMEQATEQLLRTTVDLVGEEAANRLYPEVVLQRTPPAQGIITEDGLKEGLIKVQAQQVKGKMLKR